MNTSQYEALNYLKSNPQTSANDFGALFHPDLIDSLLHNHLIRLGGIRLINGINNYDAARYGITQEGYTAMEYYETSLRNESREKDKLQLFQKQLDIHQQEIEDGKKDNASNRLHSCINTWIAGISLAVSIGSLLASIFK